MTKLSMFTLALLTTVACKKTTETIVMTGSADKPTEVVEPKPTEAPKPAPTEAAKPAEAPKPAPTGPATAVTFDEAIKQGDDLKDKLVVVTAVSWGLADMTTGGKQLSLGSVPLTGMQQSHLVAEFAGANAGEVAKLPAKDATVKLRCVMGEFEYGAYQLKDCTVVK